MTPANFSFSQKSQQTPESPISYFMAQALGNPNLISLAAGMVDGASLPVTQVAETVEHLLHDRAKAQAALQYGTTQGYRPLQEKIVQHVAHLDQTTPDQMGIQTNDVLITTGSQQLLYMLSELLVNPGDIVITEAPSYFVYHSVLASNGCRVLTVPMDDEGMVVSDLECLLDRLDRTGELHRVKLIYTVDYYQNPTGLTLSVPRRQQLLHLVERYAKKHRLLILEDAAYRELRYEGPELPSIKSFDVRNQHVVYAGTFSKPCAPGLKTGYAVMPHELIEPMVRLKGNHDFGSNNLSQHIIDHLMASGAYASHVEHLRTVYRAKRNAMVESLELEFGDWPDVSWTTPQGGMFVWLTLPTEIATSPGSVFLKAALKEGVLYIPGEFGHVADRHAIPTNEARLAFGDASVEQIREGVRRLKRAAIVARQSQPKGDTVAV